MNKKITRRAILGTLVAGLAVGPFVIHRLRRKNSQDVLHALQYAPFDVNGTEYLADVPPEKVGEAFDIFFKERDTWLGFREFSGNVIVSSESSKEKSEIHLTFQLLPSPNESRGGFPWVYQFVGKDPASNKQLWVYRLDRNDNSSHFEGERTKTEVIGHQGGIFTFPMEMMYAFSNDRLDELFRAHFKVSLSDDTPGSYAFRPLESDTGRGVFFTEGGKLSVIRTAHEGSNVGVQWEGFDWKDGFGKSSFPSRVELSELTYKEGGSFERRSLIACEFVDWTVS